NKSHKVILDVVALNFADNGRVVDQFAQTQSLEIQPEAYDAVLRDGFIYEFDVPIKQPGAYQLRIAVRDSTSGRVGAAGQFVEVPELSKHRLARVAARDCVRDARACTRSACVCGILLLR